MPLNKPALKADIITILTTLKGQTDNPMQSIEQFAEALATAIDKYVKTGTVITTGSATTQTGTIT